MNSDPHEHTLEAGEARAEFHFLDVSKTASVNEFIRRARIQTNCVGVLINQAGGAAHCAAKAAMHKIHRRKT